MGRDADVLRAVADLTGVVACNRLYEEHCVNLLLGLFGALTANGFTPDDAAETAIAAVSAGPTAPGATSVRLHVVQLASPSEPCQTWWTSARPVAHVPVSWQVSTTPWAAPVGPGGTDERGPSIPECLCRGARCRHR